MKSLARTFIFHIIALKFTTDIFIGNFSIDAPVTNYFVAAACLSGLNLLIKPILRLIFFPINALTLGLFSLIINAVVFYIFLKLIPVVHVSVWKFPGIIWPQLSIPPQEIGYYGTLLVIAAIISFITGFLNYLSK